MLSLTLGADESVLTPGIPAAAELLQIAQGIADRPDNEQRDAILFVMQRLPADQIEPFAKQLFIAGVDPATIAEAQREAEAGRRALIPPWAPLAGFAVGGLLGALIAGRGMKRRLLGGGIGGVTGAGLTFAARLLTRKQ